MVEALNETLDVEAVRASVSERAAAMVAATPVWDMTMPWAPRYVDTNRVLPRFPRAGVDVISLTVMGGSSSSLEDIFLHLARINAEIDAHPDLIRCGSIADIDAALAAGKLALIYHFQETRPFDRGLELIPLFYELGIRHALLAYNSRNRVGDGCSDRQDSGLSRWGVAVVKEMNRVGMLVDGTHSGHATTMDAMEVMKDTGNPFIFSHSNAYSVVPHYRNIKDDQIEACAATGGVIGINGLGEFLDDETASSESMYRHIHHIAQLVGARHAGLGLDFVLDVGGFWDWVQANPHMWPESPSIPRRRSAFAQPEQILELAELLLKDNWPEEDVRGVLGGNFRRVCAQVWK